MVMKALSGKGVIGGAQNGIISLTGSSEISIPTGLSTIKRFTLEKLANSSGLYYSIVVYDADIDASTYGTVYYNGSATGGGKATIGSNAPDTARLVTVKASGSSDGVIKVIPPTSSGFAGDYKWYAE